MKTTTDIPARMMLVIGDVDYECESVWEDPRRCTVDAGVRRGSCQGQVRNAKVTS